MYGALFSLCEEALIPDSVAYAVHQVGQHTGLAYGPTTYQWFWYQSPRTHALVFIILCLLCGVFYRISGGFRSFLHRVSAVTSTKRRHLRLSSACVLAFLLYRAIKVCFFISSPLSVPFPLLDISYGMLTAWVVVLGCSPRRHTQYLATILTDFCWWPLLCGGSNTSSATQQWLLCLLPMLYGCLQQHALPMGLRHAAHVASLSAFLFAWFDVISILTGTNFSYALYLPPNQLLRPHLPQQGYLLVWWVIMMVCAVTANMMVRSICSMMRLTLSSARGGKRWKSE